MDEQVVPYQIVIGQKVSEDKVLQARSLRKSMTPAERVLWQRIRNNQLEGLHFRRQQVISGFIVDFYCHNRALAVEVDGNTHDADYDRERDRILTEKGISILRFSNDEVLRQVDRVLMRILQHLEVCGR